MVRSVRHAAARSASRITRGSAETPPNAEKLARRQIRRTQLIEAAVTVIRREGPGASMDQMAAESGVTKPILYRNFTDRAGLVSAIAEYGFLQVAEGLDDALHADVTPRQLVGSTIDTYLRFIESDPEVYRFLVRQSGAGTVNINDFIWRTSRQVALVLGEGLRAAGLDSGPAEAWAFGIVGMVQAAGDWWLDRGAMPRSRLGEYLTSLLCDGLPAIGLLGTTGTWLVADDGAPSKAVEPAEPDSTIENTKGTVTPIANTRRKSS